MLRGLGAAALLILAAIASPGSARAQDENARADQLVDEAAELGSQGKYEQAIEKFKAADALVKRPIHACNIGLAYVRLSLWASAFYYLDRCKSTWKDGALPSWVTRRLKESRGALGKGSFGQLRITTVPAEARIRVDPFPGEVVHRNELWLPFGTHTVTASAPGMETAKRQIILAGKSGKSVIIELQPGKPKALVEPDTSKLPPEGSDSSAGGSSSTGTGTTGAGSAESGQIDSKPRPFDQPMVDTGDDGRNGALLYGGIGLAVASAGALTAGLLFANSANAQADDIDEVSDSIYDLCQIPSSGLDCAEVFSEEKEDIEGKRNLAYAMYGVSGAAAVASGLLLYLWLGSESDPESAPRVSAGFSGDGGTVTMSWSF